MATVEEMATAAWAAYEARQSASLPMATVEGMARRGESKYLRRVNRPNGASGARTQLGGAYREAFERAVSNYAAQGFGPERTEAYRRAYLTYAAQNYEPEAEWGARWAVNWARSMRQ